MSVKDVIKSQYLASLEMLRLAIVNCPDSLWDDREYDNVFWHIAYHALFYTDLYLQPSAEDFDPSAKHRDELRSLDSGPAGELLSKTEILTYHKICRAQVEQHVAALDLDAPSGFSWLPFNKLELQFYNIRHLQQHVGELCERLGTVSHIDVDWVGAKSDA